MNQPPTYLGFIRTALGEPNLLFNTGLLVRSNKEAARIGWHAFVHPHQIGANLDPGVADSVLGMAGFPMDRVFRVVKEQKIEQDRAQASGMPMAVFTDHYLLFDTPHEELCGDAKVYVFSAPLIRPGDPAYAPQFNAAAATRILGTLNGAGVPAHHPVATVNDQVVVLF